MDSVGMPLVDIYSKN